MSGTTAGPTRFLVSVRSGEEALIALNGGADIIDAKEPGNGALGAVSAAALAAIVKAVDGQRPVSATIGDCDLEDAASRVQATAGHGVDWVKVGLFGPPAWAGLERCAASGIRLIAVMFADRAPDWAMIRIIADAGFVGVMLDTADKSQGALRNHLRTGEIGDFLAEARRAGLLAGLAGSLRTEDAEALLRLAPDVLGFRGALCTNGERGQTLDRQRVTEMRQLMRQDHAAPVA
jgi:(5-formylfuran-3-yl)methyl phosphate synthase